MQTVLVMAHRQDSVHPGIHPGIDVPADAPKSSPCFPPH